MGMLDPKSYLTGEKGVANTGDIFILLAARITGTVTVNGSERTEAKLRIDRGNGPEDVFTTGTAIVGQIQRMDEDDKAAMAAGNFRVKLAQAPAKPGQNAANVLVSPDAPDTVATGDDDIPF